MSDWFADGRGPSEVDVPALMDSGVPDLLWRLVSSGHLVSIGTTRDRGALSVTITNDGRWKREYFRDPEAMSDWLSGAVAALVNGQGAPGGRPGSQQRSRGTRKPS